MAETAVNIVIDKLVSLLTKEHNLLRGIHDEVTSIKDLLESMTSFLKDADAQAEMANTSSGVKTWVKQTREMASNIEDVIDEYVHRVGRRRNKCGFSGFLYKNTHFVKGLFTRHEMASEIRVIKKRVHEILKTSIEYGFNSTEQVSFSSSRRDDVSFDQRMVSLYTEEAELVGIHTLRDELLDWLTGEVASRRSVSSVVGMGGVGKTTLAKKVFDNPRFTEWFHWRAWITVSQSYKNEDILRKMIAEFHRTRKESVPEGIETMDLRLLIDTLREYLQEKRYAIIFDDVWSINLWECVKLALPDNNNGSKIIITTRKGEVAVSCRETFSDQVYDLEPLSEDESWELFCKKTFRYTEGYCPPELKTFATTIVSRCGGLPLAIVAISGLLQTKGVDVSHWGKLVDSLGSELESNPHLTNITKILSFSYYDLPYQLRPCFLYFGTYPENHSIKCSTLIRKWIAEGFIKEQRGKTLEDVAEEYLTELIQRSLVQVSLVDYFSGKLRECQVHDVMREAVILLRTEDLSFSQFLEEDSSFNENSRHLSVYSNAYNIFGSIENSRAHSLCFFNGIGGPQNPLTTCNNLYKRFKLLRVLDFEDSLLDNLPKEVGYIYHLKYLSLRNTRVKILPKSIGKLVNLETLDLKHSLVHEIPIEINKLPKLRSLLAYTEDKNKEFSFTKRRGVVIQDGIECWGNMQKLYVVEATNSLVKEVGKLKQLRRFGIEKLTRKQGKDLCASIGNMPHLQSLEVAAINGDEVIDLTHISSPPQRLQTLCLMGHLEKLHDWIAGLCLLTQLFLCWSGLVGDHDPIKVLQGLPNLLLLSIYDAFSCEELHFEGGFPKLKKLRLRHLKGLKLMTIHNGALALLETLEIGSSPQMQQVPSGIRHLKNLKYLSFVDMPSHFMDGIHVQETEHRVGPRVFFVNVKDNNGFTIVKVIDSAIFM